MDNQKNSVVEKIAETIANAIGDETVALPLAFCGGEFSRSDEINAKYVLEIEEYKNAPMPACNEKDALKLLKKFAKKEFPKFWEASVLEYLPAVSEGTMKLCERVYSHDDAIRYSKALIETLDKKDLAKDFLYGVAYNAPEYRSALAAYYYVKNLPEHEFEKKYVGSVVGKNGEWEDRYNENRCEICGYSHALSSEPKMQFWHVNIDMSNFYFYGRMSRSSLNDAIMCLEEYKKLPSPNRSADDYELFKKIIEVIENTPQNMTSGKLRAELKNSGLIKMTLDQIEVFINTLGYLDILHSDDSHGMLYKHTPEKDMLYPLSDRGYVEHPVNRWTRKCGIDYDSISALFEGIYE